MRLVVFFLVIVVCWCDIRVLIDENGGYNMIVNNQIWLRSSRTGIYADDRWYSKEDKSLHLVSITTPQGVDPTLGNWNETILTYNFVRSGKTESAVGHIRGWNLVSAFTFYLETGDTVSTTKEALEVDDVRTVFPSFLIEKMNKNDERGYFTVGGMMGGANDLHAGLWNVSSGIIRTGYQDGAVVLFNITERGEGDILVLSPFSNFMSTSLTQRNDSLHSALEYGIIGSMLTIPANYMHSFIVFYSSHGVNKGVREFGQTMQRVFNRTNQYRLDDRSLNYLGYYIDNGAYYCYNTLPEKNYEDTMIEIAEQIDIPYHYMEISVWFYYKGVAGGVSNWSARPDVFPDGIPSLHRRLGYIPFIIHKRYWAYDAVYKNKYAWLLDAESGISLPASNDSFWVDLLTEAQKWGVILYQQDWLSLQSSNFRPIQTEINLADQWLSSMGAAAEQVEINLHYIMAYPRHILKVLQIPRVTQARASGDYAASLIDQTWWQWNIGITSMIIDAIGIAPNKDVLWSTSVQPGSPYGENAREALPDRAILMATLSTGPVGIGDAINFTNIERIMQCCRQDGLILKPDRAITTINELVADWTRYNGVSQGEIYSTETTINNRTFQIIFASGMKQDYTIYPSMIDSEGGIIWSFDNIQITSTFDDIHPLQVSASRFNSSSICVWYVSPLWQFNDSNQTKYALLGEWNKWTTVSRQRFLSITTDIENTQTIIVLQEVVSVVIYHSILKSVTINCLIYDQNGQATLLITPLNVVCS